MFQMSLETGMTPSLFSAMGEIPFCSVKCSVNHNDTTGKGEMQDVGIMYFVFVGAASTDRLVYGNAINRNSVGADVGALRKYAGGMFLAPISAAMPL